MKAFRSIPFFLFLALAISSCTKSNMEDNPAPALLKIGEAYASGAATKVELFAQQALTTGYNTIYITLHDSLSSQPIENAQITLQPLMDMGTMVHSCPVENPAPAATGQRYTSAIVFTMPSGSMGSWTINVLVQRGSKQGKATVPVTITEPAQSRLKSFVSKEDNGKFFIALLQPTAPKVGVNDIKIAVYRVKNMMAFPPDSSLAITLTPEMPTMGHGSPNNINPVHNTMGHYKGKVNFTMTGLWHLNLDFHAGAAVADTSTYFEINF